MPEPEQKPQMTVKLFVSLEHVTQLVAEHLRKKGFKVINGVPQTHTEGQFEDSREVLDGLSFDLEVPE
jgi:hypothetical protein